jgi:hypothetical protein
MKLIKKVAIIGLATFALGSTVAFGDGGTGDTPICAKTDTSAVSKGKDLKDAPAPDKDKVKVGVTLPPPAPAGK